MAETSDTLGARVGVNFRRGVAAQAKAWAQYGELLGQFADKKIEVTDFGRRALDVYVGAVGDVVSVGAEICTDAVKTGLDRFSGARDKAEKVIVAAEDALRKTGSPQLAPAIRRRTKAPTRPA
ncbi:MAG TPA: hypothetical protein PK808_06395 [Polymorphobacter sp.]|jgi:hypothetical protein|nr:hypothetical protein [Polymorphobacter sp.]